MPAITENWFDRKSVSRMLDSLGRSTSRPPPDCPALPPAAPFRERSRARLTEIEMIRYFPHCTDLS